MAQAILLQDGQELGQSLSALGMGVAFSGAADFSEMCAAPLRINKVIHQAVVEVNEEGTEAAAVTAVVLQRKSMPPKNRAAAKRGESHTRLYLLLAFCSTCAG